MTPGDPKKFSHSSHYFDFGKTPMKKLIWERESFSENDTENAGKALAALLKKGDFVALNGDLGAGKTAFVRGMCAVLCPEARVCSPTYTVMRAYESPNCRFYHFDVYRVTSPEDLESAGFYDCDGIVAVEWSERISYALPERFYEVTLLKEEGDRRRIILQYETSAAEDRVKIGRDGR